MSNPTPTSRNLECAVCSDASGDCRLSERGGWLCRTEVGARKLEVINGWKKVSDSACGGWGVFIEDGGEDSPDYTARKIEREQKADRKASEEQQRNLSRMPVAERDKYYRAILSQLSLCNVDRADLHRRGFTDEQIERYGFKSVNRYQQLAGKFPLNLPGISKDGSKLDNWHEGYLCAAFTADGLIQGFQIRNRHYNGDGAKYPWLSNSKKYNRFGYGAYLQDGKLPVGVYWPDELTNFDTISLCEGFAVKPQIAANLLGMPVIACDSANIASRKENFKKALKETQEKLWLTKQGKYSGSHTHGKGSQLQQPASSQNISVELSKPSTALTRKAIVSGSLMGGNSALLSEQPFTTPSSKKLGELSNASTQTGKLTAKSFTTQLVYIPDAGDIANAQVMTRIGQQFSYLKELGCKAEVLWWGQETKAGGDIDEISREQFEAAELITWRQFKAKNCSHPIAKPSEDKPVLKAKADRPIEIVKQLTEKEEKRQSWLIAMAKVAGLPANIKPTREAINARFMSRQLLPAHHTVGIYQSLALAPVNERILYLLDGQKGSRKTSVAIKSLMDAAKAAGQTCLVIVPSRLLSRDASRVLEAACHLDSGAESARHLVTCPESLYKFARQQWDVVIVDEVNEDVLRTFDGSLGVNPDLCQRVLESVLQTASTIAIANDQMYRPSVQAVQRLSGILPQETKTIQRKRAASGLAIQLYLDVIGGDDAEEEKGDDIPAASDAFYGWFARLVEAIEAGKKVAIPCGSQTRARIIDRTLRAYFKGKTDNQSRKFKGQVLDGQHTPPKVKSEFASDPDQWLARVQPHWLIWTPCFNSGVSIESDYFGAQFEALSVFEGANAASQRGERVRAVLGGGRITERHVFISNRGLSAMPDPAIFTAGYWRKLSDNVASAKAEPSDMKFAKSIGAIEFLNHHKAELIEKLDKKPELFEYWAIQARELFFKLETLLAEWLGNGWEIEDGEFTTADAKRWRDAYEDAKQSVVMSKSRALAKSKGVAAEGQDLSPYAAVRAKKHYLGEQLSHEYERLKDAEFLEAWEVAPDDSGGIKTQRVNALVKMATEDAELWATVLKLDTLRTIASGTEIESLPALPIPAKEIAAAKLLMACPGLVEVALGTLEAWDKTSQVVKDAADYLRENAERLATLTKHSQRILGLQFADTTPIIKCFHKALQMAGLTAHAAGRTNKLWRYRLQTAEDCQQKIDAKEEKGQIATHKDKRNLFRAETVTELQQQISQRLVDVVDLAAHNWQSVADELAVMGGAQSPRLTAIQSIDILMFRLAWCQSAEEFQGIRSELDKHKLDFDSECWAKLPETSQQRISSYFQLQAA